MKPLISIVIPIHNEAHIVERVTKDIYEKLTDTFGNKFELIMAENGSTDKTLEILKKLQKKLHNLRIIHIESANYGSAMKTGYLHATGEYLANSSMDWYDLPFVKKALPMLKSFDVVVGTKSRGNNDHRPFIRRLVSRGYNFALGLIFGLKVTDTHSIIVFRRKKIVPVVKKTVMDWSVFPSEVIIRAQREGLRLTEYDIVVREKRLRKKSLRKRIIRAAFGLLKLRIILWKESLRL